MHDMRSIRQSSVPVSPAATPRGNGTFLTSVESNEELGQLVNKLQNEEAKLNSLLEAVCCAFL